MGYSDCSSPQGDKKSPQLSRSDASKRSAKSRHVSTWHDKTSEQASISRGSDQQDLEKSQTSWSGGYSINKGIVENIHEVGKMSKEPYALKERLDKYLDYIQENNLIEALHLYSKDQNAPQLSENLKRQFDEFFKIQAQSADRQSPAQSDNPPSEQPSRNEFLGEIAGMDAIKLLSYKRGLAIQQRQSKPLGLESAQYHRDSAQSRPAAQRSDWRNTRQQRPEPRSEQPDLDWFAAD